MAPLKRNSDEVAAMEFANELNGAAKDRKSTEEIIRVLQRIKGDVVWTAALSRTDGGKALKQAIGTCSTSPECNGDDDLKYLVSAVLDAMHVQVREDDIREVEARWWGTAPLPEDAERITLEFRDVTPDYKSYTVKEVWPPETVECALSEHFENAAQRFRVQANKKHRHPFWPSRHFDAIVGTERASMDTLAKGTVGDIVRDLSEERIVPYVRNDEDNHSECLMSPSRHFQLWDVKLPEWCVMPGHWVEPTPPRGFIEHPDTSPALKEQFYKKVPTLHMSGRGCHIVPSAKKPEIIARSVYIPVERRTLTSTYPIHLAHDADLVPYGAELTPGKISLEEARALLGRVVQSSTEPRPDPDAPPAGKRRKVTVNKFVARRLGIAWGLEVDESGQPAWLFCVIYGGDGLGEYVVSLTGDNREYEERSPLAIRQTKCAWVGVVVLPADRNASGTKERERASDEGTSSTSEVEMSFHDWYDRTERWICNLNKKTIAPIVQVGKQGMFVAGDLEQSKGEDDEFEVEISGAKPGIWLMSINSVETDDRGDKSEHKAMGSNVTKNVRFLWKNDGPVIDNKTVPDPTVDYDALPSSADFQTDDGEDSLEWSILDTFSVDSGQVCLFSKHALDQLLVPGIDHQAMLESLLDEDQGKKVFVPAGVVVAGNDGWYAIEGSRDAEGRIIALRLRI
ncbi:hypothetical protein LXA43DRAFT_1178679 [Ganoderma leucocontextum]|nr:hypothetical protein LXA43DRAFT_1178679 [Ganoderma leucocontextum]